MCPKCYGEKWRKAGIERQAWFIGFSRLVREESAEEVAFGKQQQQMQNGPLTWPVRGTQGGLNGFSRMSEGEAHRSEVWGVGYRVP